MTVEFFNRKTCITKKYKYTKIILKTLLIAGVISVTMLMALFPAFGIIIEENKRQKIREAKEKRNKRNDSFINTFYYLKRVGLINFENKNGQIYISLTEDGRKKAGRLQIDDLKIKKPKRWDKKWRIVIFDIDSRRRIIREALRGKLKILGFELLQKSVWVHPFDCTEEIRTLKQFFNLDDESVRVMVAESIGDDKKMRQKFGLK